VTVNPTLASRVVPFAAVAMLGLLSYGSGRSTAAAAPPPVTHTVTIEDMSFQPAVLTVRAGDSVVWVNKDWFPHTATSEIGGFDSLEIPAGESWTYTPETKGEFSYVCSLHPTMKALLRVE
jgi:plastocyanin